MNLAGTPLRYNTIMNAAYKRADIPLWVTPQEACDRLRLAHWSQQISLELGEWFARIWSMAFATGYRGRKPLTLKAEHVLRTLDKMGYTPPRAQELAHLLLDNLDGLHRKGCERRDLQF